MRSWVAIAVELLDNTPFMRLPPAQRILWYEAIMEAAKQEGILPGLEDLAWKWRLPVEDLGQWLVWFLDRGWLVEVEDGFLVVNWEKHQRPLERDKGAADRMRKYREKMAVTRNVTRNNRNRYAPYKDKDKDIDKDINTISSTNVLSPPASPPEGKKVLIPIEKRDPDLALWYSAYRCCWNQAGRLSTFWGSNAIAEKYRKRCKSLFEAHGEDAIWGMVGLRHDPWWCEHGVTLEHALRSANVEKGIKLIQRSGSEAKAREQIRDYHQRMMAEETGGTNETTSLL
jgi:hypothetical protein